MSLIIPSSLSDLKGSYPAAKRILSSANSGSESDRRKAREYIARLWLSEGIPYAFKNCPAVYEALRDWLVQKIDINPKEISMVGSARIGESLSRAKLGKRYGQKSDLDLFAVSDVLFKKVKSDFEMWAREYDHGLIRPNNDRQARYWRGNRENAPNNIGRGFINCDKIPNIPDRYPNAPRINNLLYILRVKMKSTGCGLRFKKASLRCYCSWDSYVNQVSINLANWY